MTKVPRISKKGVTFKKEMKKAKMAYICNLKEQFFQLTID